jgi:RNA polymerase sigma-70 factor (ECF subfamily)
MVAALLDRCLAAQFDPSDVVQDALLEADRRLEDYLRTRPLPFYPWLRQIATDRLKKLRRDHVLNKGRSVTREAFSLSQFPEGSALDLASSLRDDGDSPSAAVQREEMRRQVREALGRLRERDRQVLQLRQLEELPIYEVAAILGISENAASARHLRALRRLGDLLRQRPGGEGGP